MLQVLQLGKQGLSKSLLVNSMTDNGPNMRIFPECSTISDQCRFLISLRQACRLAASLNLQMTQGSPRTCLVAIPLVIYCCND